MIKMSKRINAHLITEPSLSLRMQSRVCATRSNTKTRLLNLQNSKKHRHIKTKTKSSSAKWGVKSQEKLKCQSPNIRFRFQIDYNFKSSRIQKIIMHTYGDWFVKTNSTSPSTSCKLEAQLLHTQRLHVKVHCWGNRYQVWTYLALNSKTYRFHS